MNYRLHVTRLQAGQTTQFRPHGNSMVPRIHSGDLVTVAPLTQPPKPDDIVLCRVAGHYYVHLVTALQGERVQIGNNKGHINGWTKLANVYGAVTKVES